MSEALEMRIERAWCRLNEYARPTTRATLYLTPQAAIYGFAHDMARPMPAGSVEIGTYTKMVALDDLRKDVFFVFGMQREGHQ